MVRVAEQRKQESLPHILIIVFCLQLTSQSSQPPKFVFTPSPRATYLSEQSWSPETNTSTQVTSQRAKWDILQQTQHQFCSSLAGYVDLKVLSNWMYLSEARKTTMKLNVWETQSMGALCRAGLTNQQAVGTLLHEQNAKKEVHLMSLLINPPTYWHLQVDLEFQVTVDKNENREERLNMRIHL